MCFYMMCNSYDIKMLRFELEMKEHYRAEQEKHDLLIHAIKGLLWDSLTYSPLCLVYLQSVSIFIPIFTINIF